MRRVIIAMLLCFSFAFATQLPKDYDAQQIATVIDRINHDINILKDEQTGIIVSESQPKSGLLWFKRSTQELRAYLGNEWRLTVFADDSLDGDLVTGTVAIESIENGGFLYGLTDTIQNQINAVWDSTLLVTKFGGKADTVWVQSNFMDIDEDFLDPGDSADVAYRTWVDATYLALADTNYTDSTDIAGMGYHTYYPMEYLGSNNASNAFTGGTQNFKINIAGLAPSTTVSWITWDAGELTKLFWAIHVTAAGVPGDVRLRLIDDGGEVWADTISISGVADFTSYDNDISGVSIAAGSVLLLQAVGIDFTGTIQGAVAGIMIKAQE